MSFFLLEKFPFSNSSHIDQEINLITLIHSTQNRFIRITNTDIVRTNITTWRQININFPFYLYNTFSIDEDDPRTCNLRKSFSAFSC